MLIAANVVEMFRDFLNPYGRHFRSKGWQVDALGSGVSRSDDCNDAFDNTYEIEWTRDPLDAGNWRKAPRQLRDLVAFRKYDLVHVHTPVAAFITRMSLRNRGIRGPKIIYTAHGFHFHPQGSAIKNVLFRSMEQIAGRWTDYLVVINRCDERAALKHNVVPRERLVYMPGIGIDLERYDRERVIAADLHRVRSELKLSAGDDFFLMVAEYTPGKRHADALQAFSRLTNRSVRLVFAGEGPLLDGMRSLAAQLGISDRVHFLGYRRDIPTLMRTCAATILPSEREGLPRAIMEALALETPVIATDIRGCRDLLADGAGSMIPVGDHQALTRCMDWLLQNRGAAASMAQVGRERLRSHDIANVLRMHEDLYQEAVGGQVAKVASYESHA